MVPGGVFCTTVNRPQYLLGSYGMPNLNCLKNIGLMTVSEEHIKEAKGPRNEVQTSVVKRFLMDEMTLVLRLLAFVGGSKRHDFEDALCTSLVWESGDSLISFKPLDNRWQET